jgi:Rap1a immunity proteins
MKMRVAMLATVMLVGLSARASALTGNELLAECEQLEKAWVIQGKDVQIRRGMNEIDMGKCWGYLNAYFDLAYMTLVDPENPTGPPKPLLHVCPPNGVSFVQFIRMFLQRARNNPAQLHTSAFFLIQNMLSESFPCSQ